MRKFLMATVTVAGLALAASQAQADDFTGTFDSTFRTHDLGLVIQVAPTNAAPTAPGSDASGSINFSLSAANPSQQVDLFTIYTNEASVDLDDLIPFGFDLSMNLTDTNIGASFGGDIGGLTGGFDTIARFRIQDENGYLVWADNGHETLNFGNGGVLDVYLTNPVTFNLGRGSHLAPGIQNGAQVYATFDWTQSPAGVPEPASWALMIGGFGLAGAALRRRASAATA